MEAPVFDDFFNQTDILRSDIGKVYQLIEEVNRFQDLMLTSPLAVGNRLFLIVKTNPNIFSYLHRNQTKTRWKNVRNQIIRTKHSTETHS